MRPLAAAFVAWIAASPGAAAELALPTDFLWGTATAAHQVEGGNSRNDWWDWEQLPGTIANGDRSGQASDHYARFSEDLDLARELGTNAYRLSIEWSRIEPRPGEYDEAEIQHYREVLRACRERGIEPSVTLFHFTLPRWAAERGGFSSRETVHAFARFATLAAESLGDLVDHWCTVNEPMVYLSAGYLAGVFPPGEVDGLDFARAFVNLVRGHGRAYRALHEHDTSDADGDGVPAQVGIAKHMRIFEPWDPEDTRDRAAAWAADKLFNRAFLAACTRGRTRLRLPGGREVTLRLPFMRHTLDYFGLNYYSRDLVDFDPEAPGGFRRRVPPGAPVSDLGWELYPEGLYRLLMDVRDHDLPIFVTENGLADAADTRRADFLRGHLGAVAAALRDGADVRGYFHWSLLDNFEWAEGFEPRFGLYRVDYSTQERVPTRGAEAYAGIISRGTVPDPGFGPLAR